MMKPRILSTVLLAFCAAIVPTTPVYAGTFRVVTYLTYIDEGPGYLVELSPGIFYGASVQLFSVTKQGTVTNLTTFSDPPYIIGSTPGAIGANGLLYSSISQVQFNAATANVFSLGTTASSLVSYPAGKLGIAVAGSLPNGNLFGSGYNILNDQPCLNETDLNGNVIPLYQFPPSSELGTPIYSNDGSYYGIYLVLGGPPTSLFFQFTPSGAFNVTTLPFIDIGTVLQGSDGNFYGIQPSEGCGSGSQPSAIYKLTPSGQFSILHQFGTCGLPANLIEASDGKLYGVIQNKIFSLTKSGTYTVVYALSTQIGYPQGLCPCTLTQGSDGILYGAAVGGGTGNDGVIFAFDNGLPIPVPQAHEFSPHHRCTRHRGADLGPEPAQCISPIQRRRRHRSGKCWPLLCLCDGPTGRPLARSPLPHPAEPQPCTRILQFSDRVSVHVFFRRDPPHHGLHFAGVLSVRIVRPQNSIHVFVSVQNGIRQRERY